MGASATAYAEGRIVDEQLIHEPRETVQERGDTYITRGDTHVARGDSLLDEGEESRLQSELPKVPDDLWTQFVRCMISSTISAVSPSNALGMFEMMPRRLDDLDIVARLSRSKSPEGKTIWVAVFMPPLTCDKFLKSPHAQYRVFSKSMKDYAGKVADGEIKKNPEMSLSGALAVLHRCGPMGLKTWENGEHFPATQAVYDRVAGLF